MTDKAYNGIQNQDWGWHRPGHGDFVVNNGNYDARWVPGTNFQRVGEFMRAMDQDCLAKAAFPDAPVTKLRVDLIAEELEELECAIVEGNLVDVADALTDLLYVVYGAGHAFGIDLDKCFGEVHRSNMTKLGPDGRAIRRSDGKVLKPETYEPPMLTEIVYGKQ